MEEASVAGESPDRSKQRESSAEPTPGSASPVPEARGERDPRLAVAREDGTSSTAQRGGVDTATKIFSIRELRTEETEGREAEAGGSVDADGSDGAEASAPSEDADTQNPSAKGSPEGDARLRAAVAAWVSSGSNGEKPTGTEDPEGAEGSDGAEGSEDAEDVATAEGPEDAETPAGGPEAEGDGDGAESSAPGALKGAETAQETDAGERAEDAGAGGDPAVTEDAEAPAGVADAEPPAGATDAEGSATSPSTDGPEDTGAGAEASDSAAAGTDSESESEGDDDVTEGEQVADARPEAADTVSDETPGSGPAEAEADAAEAGAAPEDAEDATDADPRTTGTDTEDAAPADARPKAADDESAPEGPPAADDETRTGGADGNTKAAEGEAEAVDHPTAVFKAPRPPKPAVDQPTTMLKAPAAPKTPEAPAERTSKFVALKPLDEPRTPRRDTPRPDATRPVPQVGPERTTQVPLPPKPPLDLLAELTNTPPPPETPVRTAIRRVKIWTPLVILLAIVFAVVQALRPLPTPSLTLTADDSYTFDGSKANLPWPSEGQGWMDVNGIGTMGSFGKQTPVAIGSVAKAMTAYIVLKDHPLKAGAEGEKITVDATAEKEGGYDKDGESTLNTVKAGDVLTEKQALSAIMIPSANNIARLLARWDAGSEAAFIKKMNDTAKSLGMTNTTYTDASGLKETTVSSAEDQVKLGNQLVKIQALMDITKLPSWVDPSGHKWTNYNRLVPYNNSLGIKTGTTTAAGGNLLFAATKEVGGETAVVVGAILGQHTAPIIDTVNAVSKTAMLAAQDAMTSAKILKKGTVVGYVDDQLGGHTPVVVTKDVAAVGWAGLKVKLSFAPDAVPHTAKAGTKVGTLTVGDGSSGAVKVPVALQKDLAEPALTAKLTRLG
ncbi:D-alanyl-D-alanine carboxypeptidase [Streptomyces sp. NBC_00989]|uniref:D-alanyl-D-alanine carboxypeptidase n=1 Tax=Streptomyces sp. NBC_00989 TaxID=2903705 RepID=UPI00386E8412|nr:D-alanyl-D-alanine carboxypeptidase [Streptomyces sp. NBC_00989]